MAYIIEPGVVVTHPRQGGRIYVLGHEGGDDWFIRDSGKHKVMNLRGYEVCAPATERTRAEAELEYVLES